MTGTGSKLLLIKAHSSPGPLPHLARHPNHPHLSPIGPAPFPSLYNMSSVVSSVSECGWAGSLFHCVFNLRLSNIFFCCVHFYMSYLKDSDLTEAATLSNKEFLRFSFSSLSSSSSGVSSFLCTRNIRHQG